MNRILLALALLVSCSFDSVALAGHGHWGYGHWHYGPRVGVGHYRPYINYRPAYGWGRGYASYASYRYRAFYPRTFVYSANYFAPITYGYRGFNFAYPAYYPSCQTTYYGDPLVQSYAYPAVPPAEYYYGPQAVQRFLGNAPVNNIAANANAGNFAGIAATILNALKPELQQRQQVAAQPVVSAPSESLPMARSRARRMIEVGDRYFAEQKYFDAAQKYREATRTSADLAEAQFRLAHAETALGRFAEAAAAYRQALAANPNINREGFTLDDLYGDAQIAKKSHLEAAAAAALQAPDDSSYLLVVGMFLRYDNEPDRAVKFIRKAWEMGDLAPHLARYWGAQDAEVLVSDTEI